MPIERYPLEVGFRLMPDSLSPKFRKDFPSYIDGMSQTVPGNYLLFPEYPKRAEDVYNLKPRADDVYVLTFPKSGSFILS